MRKTNTSEKVDLLDDAVKQNKEVDIHHLQQTGPFSFRKENYKILYIGLAINVLGFLLMIGGAAENPNEFHADQLFSFTRITLAPFLIVLGYAIIGYSIMKKPKS